MADSLSGLRTFIVPPDIVPVRRVSPIRVKKRTVWRERPEGEPLIRPGREWFGDQLFAESGPDPVRTRCVTSLAVHVGCAIVVIAILAVQSGRGPLVKVVSPLAMPSLTWLVPVAEAAGLAPAPSAPSTPKPDSRPPAAAAPPQAADPAAAPIDAPATIEPEAGIESGEKGVDGGIEDGVEGGVAGGIAGGVVGGVVGGGGGSTLGPIRLGAGVDPPRKLKDVKPIYPQGAVAGQARGTVVIEAVVGIDGMVHDVKVINSVPLLDQAALDAVRQWEFAPARVNGAPVAVIITIIVQFAIY